MNTVGTAGSTGVAGGTGAVDPARESLLSEVRDDLARRGVGTPTPAEIAVSVQRLTDGGGRRNGDGNRRRRRHGAVGAQVDDVRALAREFSGLGELAVPLADSAVTDVLLNGPGPVWVDRGEGLEATDLWITDPVRCREIAVRLAAACGVRLDDARPFADGVLTALPPGVVAQAVRVHAVLDQLSGQGTCVSLRALSTSHRNLEALRRAGMFPPEIGRLLRTLVRDRCSLLLSGGTGAGKTTLLAALLAEVPGDQRILLVEDTPELMPDHPHVVGLRTRVAGVDGVGEIDVRTLVRQSLRMRPDRVVVGEIRGAEIAELLLAFNSGHAGSAGTVHANSVSSVPGRLTALGSLAGLAESAVARQVIDGIGVVVHVERTAVGRRVSQIGRFLPGGGGLSVETVWDAHKGWNPAQDLTAEGELQWTR